MVSWDMELSSIDTALLLADPRRQAVSTAAMPTRSRSALADSIYRRVNFPFMVNASGKRLRHG
jgi:hypothetical protein